MLPNDLKFCAADVLVNSDNFETGIFIDPKTGTAFDGWRDHSGLDNHLIVRSGKVAHETREGVEGVLLDGTVLLSMRQYLTMGAGTLALSFSDGYKANTSRSLVTIETFDTTTTRTGNPAWALLRNVGGGSNRTFWGASGQTVTVNLAGSSAGDATVQRVAYGVDIKTGRASIYGKREGQAAVSGAKNANAHVLPRGADLVFGRLDQTVDDASRTVLPGNEKMWLSHVQMWGNFQEGNLISDYPAELEALFGGMK